MKKKISIILIIALAVFVIIFYTCIKKQEKYFIYNYKDGMEEIKKIKDQLADRNNDSQKRNIGQGNPALLSFPRENLTKNFIIFESFEVQLIRDIALIELTLSQEEIDKYTHIQLNRYDGPRLVANISVEDGEKDGNLYRYKIIDNEKEVKDIYASAYSVGGINKNTLKSSGGSWSSKEKKPELSFSNLCIWILSWFN